jgi:catechol 2,3-dioxygenase-like lactoylglutathione lyase family enzyme
VPVIVGSAHTGICVPDVEAAVTWYRDVLGLKVLSPPYEMHGPQIERDMGELVPAPVVIKAAIVGLDADDHVLEILEYPAAGPGAVIDRGITHVGLVCDDVAATRARLSEKGVAFATSGTADVAGLETTWFRDPWGNLFILMGKSKPDRPYWRQYG